MIRGTWVQIPPRAITVFPRSCPVLSFLSLFLKFSSTWTVNPFPILLGVIREVECSIREVEQITIKERQLHSAATSSFMFEQSSGYSSYICISTYLKAILILYKLHKILNTNTMKLRYCCTTNMTGIIRQHNSNALNATATPNEAPLSNCRNKQTCPLDGKCLSSCIVYRAEVIKDNNTKIYYGASEGEFKTRYNNHIKSFRHKKYCNETELSRHTWTLKDNNINYSLHWSIESETRPISSLGCKAMPMTNSFILKGRLSSNDGRPY